jgi:Tfp pilus assembly protein PilW
MAVTSSPANGTIGHTTIRATAKLTGSVQPGTLTFQVSDQPSAETGKPATTQHVVVQKAGTYAMPLGFRPNAAGSWAVTVTFTPVSTTASKLSVSGLPPVTGQPAPFPQLVTVVHGG